MFVLRETIGTHRVPRVYFPTFAETVAFAKATRDILHFEEDADFPGEAADFITTAGTLYAIERARD